MKFGIEKNTLTLVIAKAGIRSISANSLEINGDIEVKSNSSFTDSIGNTIVFTTNQTSTCVIKTALLNGEAFAQQFVSNNPNITITLEDVSYSENRITAAKTYQNGVQV